MFKRILVSLVILASSFPAKACINEYNQYPTELPLLENGRIDLAALILKTKSGTPPYWHYGFTGENNLQSKMNELREQLKTKPGDFRILSDLAALELKAGSKADGLKMLEELYGKYPDEYNIVANLGTAYELAGNNAKALELINRAISINPQSHYGSEWIHLRILEYKTGKRAALNSIIGLNQGDDFAAWIRNKEYKFPRPPDSLQVQIAYQLHERIAFLPAPDSIIAQLVIDFADITAKDESLAPARDFYLFALPYNPGLKQALELRIQFIQSSNRVISIIWMIPLAIILLAMTVGVMRRMKKKN